MLGSVLIGLIAAGLATLPAAIHSLHFGAFQGLSRELAWTAPIFILGIASVAMLIQRFVLDPRPGTRAYDGLSDLFIHIHSPATPDSSTRWSMHALISLLLSVFGGAAGPEGASVELTHAFSIRFRSRSARWFEQRRRTDAATCLAAGIAAAFGAPFAAILVPSELGIGGRATHSMIAALTAFLASRYFMTALGIQGDATDFAGALYGLRFMTWDGWLGVLVVAVAAGAASAFALRFIRYSQDSLLDLFQTQTWMRTLAGGVLLFLVALVYDGSRYPARELLDQVLWARHSGIEVTLLFGTHLLRLALVLAAFGTVGLFWPILGLGGFLGFAVQHWALRDPAGFGPTATLAGAASLWGAMLGAPISGAVLVFEMTRNTQVLLPCLAAALVARQVRRWLRTSALVENDLRARGMRLIEGRSASVLSSILVKDAMVSDHEIVHENEPVSALYSRLLKSRYPFLPVVNAQGTFCGLLTADMVEDAWKSHVPVTSNSPLAKLLEAKDLLYRSGFKCRTVKASDRLSVTGGMFYDIPCVPVLSDDNRVLGLLFVYSVRLSYDREVARRSFAFENPEA